MKIHKLILMSVVLSGLTALADYTTMRVISVNLGADRAVAADGDGILPVPADIADGGWVNMKAKGTNTSDVVWGGTAAETIATPWKVERTTAGISWYSTGSGIMKGYIDDHSSNLTAKFTDIPFAVYDVYVYLAADGGSNFLPVQILEGTNTTSVYYSAASNGNGIPNSTANWGERQNAAQLGKNVIVMRGLSASQITVYTPGVAGGSTVRCGLAAIQIAERLDYATNRVISVNLGADYARANDGDGILSVPVNASKGGWVEMTAKGTNTSSVIWGGTAAETVATPWKVERTTAGGSWYMTGASGIMYGYIDDHSNNLTAKFTDLPFAKYDIYVYLAADGGSNFLPVQILEGDSTTSVYYSAAGDGNGVRTSTSNWGSRQYTAQPGKNVIVIRGQTASQITVLTPGVSGGSTVRCGLAAIQIVEAENETFTPTLSVNFNSSRTDKGFNVAQGVVTGCYGLALATNWVTTTTGANGSNIDLPASDGSGVAKLDYGSTSGVTWQYQLTSVDPALQGYLDDSVFTISVTNIPFAYYDVIVYQATDTANAKFNPPSVNGVWWSYDGLATATTRAATALQYGVSRQGHAAVGTNAIYLQKGFSGDLTIVGAGTDNAAVARGGLAAMQIIDVTDQVEVLAPGTVKDFSTIPTNTLRLASSGDITIKWTGTDMAVTSQFACVSTVSVKGAVTFENFGYNGTLESSAEGNTYSEGASSPSVGTPILWKGGSITLEGTTPFYIKGASSVGASVQTTVNMNGITAVYTDGYLGVGKATYNVADSAVSATNFVLGNWGAGNDATFNLTGSSVLTVSGGTIADTTSNSIMFGHWNTATTFTIADSARLVATNTQILVGKTQGTHTINVGGGTIETKGIRAASAATGTNTLNLNGGTLKLGTIGIDSYSANSTLQINVTENSTIVATDTTLPITQPIAIAAGKTLTFTGESTNQVVTLTGAVTEDEGAAIVLENVKMDLGALRPTINFQNGAIALSATFAELVAGQVELNAPASMTAAENAQIDVVDSSGRSFAVSSVTIADGKATIRLPTLGPITDTKSISALELSADASGTLIIVGANSAENAYDVTFDEALPANVKVLVSGYVNLKVANGVTLPAPAAMSYENGAVITVDSSCSLSLPSGVTVNTTGDLTLTLALAQGATNNVLSGTCSLQRAADQSVNGTVNIAKAATVKSLSSDPLNYQSNPGPVVTVYGALDLGTTRWSIGTNARVYLKSGCTVSGTGDSYGAISGVKSTLVFDTEAGGEAITLAAKITSVDQLINGAGTIALTDGGELRLGNANSGLPSYHLVATNGTSTLYWGVGVGAGTDGSDTLTNPFIAVAKDAELNFYMRDFSGWEGAVASGGWIVNAGKINILNWSDQTKFFRNHLVFGDGSELVLGASTRPYVYGGTATEETAQIQLASGTATISGAGDITLGRAGNAKGTYGSGLTVGKQATLTMTCNNVTFESTLAKYGEGTLDLSAVSTVTTNGCDKILLYAGTIKSPSELSVEAGDPAHYQVRVDTLTDEFAAGRTIYRYRALKPGLVIILY